MTSKISLEGDYRQREEAALEPGYHIVKLTYFIRSLTLNNSIKMLKIKADNMADNRLIPNFVVIVPGCENVDWYHVEPAGKHLNQNIPIVSWLHVLVTKFHSFSHFPIPHLKSVIY